MMMPPCHLVYVQDILTYGGLNPKIQITIYNLRLPRNPT